MEGQTYDVVFVCGLVICPFKLTNNPTYPAVAADVAAVDHQLRPLRADVMLGAHGLVRPHRHGGATRAGAEAG